MKIPIFKLNFSINFILNYFVGSWNILRSGRPLGESRYVEKFSKSFSVLQNCKYSIPVANGTVAIELIIKAIGIKNKEIILPSNTFFATIVAVENSGNTPILVDIENSSFSVCPIDLRKKITANTAALILVHIGGIISSKIEEIIQICNENQIKLIEDAAHAHLSSFHEQKAGTIGIAGAFSFFPTKVMTTGEGGMITTNSEDLYQKIKSLKNFGRDNNNAGIIINESGNNFKINEFTGLFGYLECQRVEKRVKKRNYLIEIYRKELLNTEFKVVTQKEEYGCCSYYKCIVLTPYEVNNEFKEFFKLNNISLTGEVYSLPIHMQPLYSNRYLDYSFPNTDYFSKHHFCPPLYPELNKKEVKYICEKIKEYSKNRK
jgi:dTDP-4-amino-4,6-dideoxygalactose transaminase